MLTHEQAIDALRALAEDWPPTLTLFSWSGTLCVCERPDRNGPLVVLDQIPGIPNDGGDPSENDIVYAED